MIRVLVVAPQLALRAGLHQLIQSDEQIDAAGEAAALTELESLAMDFDVLLYAAPDAHFTADLAGLEQALPPGQLNPALLLLTDFLEEAPRLDRLPVRGWGILPLDAPPEEITAAVHAVQEGLVVGYASLVQAVFDRSHTAPGAPAHPGSAQEELTGREAEVLQLLSQGLPNKQIARALNISEHTVKFHISSIYTKLGVTNRTEAVRVGVQQGLVVL